MSDIANSAFGLVKTIGSLIPPLPGRREVEPIVQSTVEEVQRVSPFQASAPFVRIAGLSGAIALGLEGYGSHVFREKEKSDEMKSAFATGHKYHLLHTIALLGIAHTRKPTVVGSLMVCGMVLFSGSCYYHAFTGDKTVRKVTPYGGILLLLAWASMIL